MIDFFSLPKLAEYALARREARSEDGSEWGSIRIGIICYLHFYISVVE